MEEEVGVSVEVASNGGRHNWWNKTKSMKFTSEPYLQMLVTPISTPILLPILLFSLGVSIGVAADSWMAFTDRFLTLDDNSNEKNKLNKKMLKLIDIYYDALDAPKSLDSQFLKYHSIIVQTKRETDL
ncbi:hypothetical protein AgCh_024412 [Apium graveolens]